MEAPDGPKAPSLASSGAQPTGDENSLACAELQDLPQKIQSACSRAGWTGLTPIQSLALPCILAGKDVMAQSRTGSGKTGCYLLPMLESLDPAAKFPQALILAPTRELVIQVAAEAQILFEGSGISPCAIYGGVGYQKQLDALKSGCQVVIGTPGRILDHLLRGSLNFHKLRVMVFDEADRMLSIGFYPDIMEISRYLPQERQTSMFSATYPPHVLRLSAEFMKDPIMISLSRKEVHVAEVEHLFCEVAPMDKDRALVRLLETENPSSAIIFCNTKANVRYVAGVLKGFGYSADELSADLSQKKRENVIAKIRGGELKFLVATDVAARGIDIPELSHVFLYEPPEDRESYIHRAGRTGRAGASGTVISLVDVMQRLELERIGKFYKINLKEITAPTDADVARTVCERLKTLLESRSRSLTGLEKMRAERYMALAEELTTMNGEEDESRLSIIAMLLDDYHRQTRSESRAPRSLASACRPAGDRARHRNRKRGRTGRQPQAASKKGT